jgi:hypothetical protein
MICLTWLDLECALDPSRWDRTLADVSKALDCFALLLALSDLRRERLLIHKRIGVEPDQFERLSIYVPEVNAMLRGALASRLSEALDALRCAVVLVNEGGSILHATRAAESHPARRGRPSSQRQRHAPHAGEGLPSGL